MIQELRQLAHDEQSIGEVRGVGLAIGIEFVKDSKKKTPDPIKTSKVVQAAFKHGVIVGSAGPYNNVIRISPPLIISEEKALRAVEGIKHALHAV
jgi:4-aminobutyrate aminotransferase-like enzyme